VSYVDKDPSKGAIITLENRDRLVMPATVQIDFKDGTHRRVQLPAETWIRSAQHSLRLDSSAPIVRVTVDPDHVIPDKDRSNNVIITTAPAAAISPTPPSPERNGAANALVTPERMALAIELKVDVTSSQPDGRFRWPMTRA
jgi:hypothetical protein